VQFAKTGQLLFKRIGQGALAGRLALDRGQRAPRLVALAFEVAVFALKGGEPCAQILGLLTRTVDFEVAAVLDRTQVPGFGVALGGRSCFLLAEAGSQCGDLFCKLVGPNLQCVALAEHIGQLLAVPFGELLCVDQAGFGDRLCLLRRRDHLALRLKHLLNLGPLGDKLRLFDLQLGAFALQRGACLRASGTKRLLPELRRQRDHLGRRVRQRDLLLLDLLGPTTVTHQMSGFFFDINPGDFIGGPGPSVITSTSQAVVFSATGGSGASPMVGFGVIEYW